MALKEQEECVVAEKLEELVEKCMVEEELEDRELEDRELEDHL
jgi:hypothetical protein